ncbi:unnamed protein product, partial [Callosobruchus maculatus]
VPQTEGEWKRIQNEYHLRWNFANCCGALDRKHIVIRNAPHSGSEYFSYKGSSTEFRKKKTRPDRLSGGSPGRFHRGHHLLDPKDKTRIKKIYQMITILWLIVILASGGRSTVELKYPKFHSMNDNPGLLPLKLGNAQN